jgi:tetratricopeptide (TPR) repeat protein/anti-sigma regulatory factor (Ser/Thr protein kinase)
MARIVLLISVFSSLSLAQQSQFDSLVNALNTHTQEDTTRLNLLNDLAYRFYSNIDPLKGLERAEEAIALAHKLSNQTKLAQAYRSKGINYWAQDEYASALEMYGLAAKIYEDAHDEQGMADAFNNIGVVYLSLADYSKALDYYLKAQRIYKKSGNKRLANTLTNIGIVHKNLSHTLLALEYYKKALTLYKESGDTRGIATALGNIGNAYDDLDSTSQALEYHRRSLAINETLGNKRGIANGLNSMGIIHGRVSHYSQALEYLQQSLRLYEQLGDKYGMSVASMEIGGVYRKAPDGFLIERGIAPSTRYARVLVFQKRALQLATEIGAIDKQAFAWEELSNTYAGKRDFPRALEAFKKCVALRDSIMNDEKRAAIAAKTMQFEFDKKEALLKAEQEKKEELAAERLNQQQIQNNSVMGGAAILLLAGVTSFLFYKKRIDADRQRKDAEFRAQVSDTEMKALRSQMNPHFIFNSLNSISDYLSKHDLKTADYYLTKFAKLMRLILEHSERKEVTLSDDLQALELYLQLEALRLNNKFKYEIIVDEAIDKESTLVPPLLLQPFVENSIWHGIAPKVGEGKILIRITKEDGMINCIVEDNGVGRNQSEPVAGNPESAEKQSLGMKITKARIEILNATKQTEGKVVFSDLPEGMRVEVKLPLVLQF